MKKRLIRLIISILLFAAGWLLLKPFFILGLILLILAYFTAGYDVLWDAVKNIAHGKLFDENFLMSVATIGALCVKEYTEAVAVMIFFQLGELFQSYAVNKSRKSISELMDIRPDYANKMINGKLEKIDPYDVNINDEIIIQSGEKVPLDGIVLNGSSLLDTSALTGESVPRDVKEGDTILSGCINLNGVLTVKVTSEFGESTVNKILDLVENAGNKKSASENFITKFSFVYTPIVIGLAVLLAVIPPFIFSDTGFVYWLQRALSFLVVSCPCALVISIPLSFFGGIGGASRSGILVKGSNYLEALAHTEIVVWDKTGTLTQGIFEVQNVHPVNCSSETLLEMTAYAESHSSHPISLSLKRAYLKEIDFSRVKEVEELSGHGVRSNIDGFIVLAGNHKLMEENAIFCDVVKEVGTIVYVAIDGKYAGYIVIADKVKDDSQEAIAQLKKAGIRKNVMLTGDVDSVGQKIASDLNLDSVYTQLLPTQKVEKIELLLKEKSKHGKLVFVGDGINDAPSLALSDIGVAMGALGSDVAIEAADVVIMTDEPSKLVSAIRISKRTLKIAKENIIFALAVKILILILIALGFATMWAAVFADVGVCVLAILNSMRALSKKKI